MPDTEPDACRCPWWLHLPLFALAVLYVAALSAVAYVPLP